MFSVMQRCRFLIGNVLSIAKTRTKRHEVAFSISESMFFSNEYFINQPAHN